MVDLDREKRTLVADGNVVNNLWEQPKDDEKKKGATPVLTMVTRRHMVYTDEDRLAVYTGGVTLNRPDLHEKSRSCALISPNRAPIRVWRRLSPMAPWRSCSTAQRPLRTGTAEHSEYFTDDQKVILPGGDPKLVDIATVRRTGSTEGAESLTYFANDDRLLGSRAPQPAGGEAECTGTSNCPDEQTRNQGNLQSVSRPQGGGRRLRHVKQGEVVGLLGPNGAGKTTSFYMIVGLISPDSGRILVDGQDITGLPMYQRARRGISYLPQEASVFRKLTVEENLMAILETLLDARAVSAARRMDRLIDQLGLEKVRRSQGYMLSGGERRRVEIARSLVIDPSFLLLDEPFSGIDPIQVLELQRIIFDLKRAGIGILITDHNVRETLTVTDRAYIINNGRIFRAGSPEALERDPEVKRIYLGESFSLRV